MGLLKDNSVIHEANLADTTKYVYTQVYCGTNASPTINGVVVNMVGGSTIDIRVGTISPTAGIYVIGSPIDTVTGSVIL